MGLDEYHLYLGTVETSKFSLWSSNGVWPVWSRNDQFIYYLAPRKEGTRFTVAENLTRPYYDLVRRQLDTETEELLLKDIEPPGVPGAQLAELADSRILKFTSSYQLILLPAASELAKSTIQNTSGTPLISLEELTGKLDPLGTIYNLLPPSFSVSRAGKMAVVTSPGNPALLLDLANLSKIATIDGLEMATNVTWSFDDNSFAYTNRQGIASYDVATGETRTVVTNLSLGFRADDPWSGIGLPMWVFDGKALLFTALSADWVKPGTESRVEPFILSVTGDGSAMRSIGYYGLESVSPDGHHAIIRQPDPKTGALTTGETTLWLVDIQDKNDNDL